MWNVQHWRGWMQPRPYRRSLLSRRVQRRGIRRLRSIVRLIGKLCFGMMLVGCASSFASRQTPLEVLRTSQVSDQRIVAYRSLQDPEKLAPADRETALARLVAGSNEETSPLVRAAVARSLGSYSEPEAARTLHRLANDSEVLVRVETCRSMGRLKSQVSVEVLGQLALNDVEADVRLAAAEALAQIPAAEAEKYLTQCLRDKELAVTQAALTGLRNRTGFEGAATFAEWSRYLDDRAKRSSAIAEAISPSELEKETGPTVASKIAAPFRKGAEVLTAPVRWFQADPKAEEKLAPPKPVEAAEIERANHVR